MRVGVVIVNYNGARYVAECLRSLRRQSCAPDGVFVIDNASTDGSADLIASEFPEVALVRSASNLGFAGGVNVGIRWCQERGHDAVLILNPDTVVDTSALEALTSAAIRHPRACLTPLVVRADRPDVVASYAGELVWWRGRVAPRYLGQAARDQPRSDVRIEMANGACVLLPLVAVEAGGLLDESYFLYFEDTDYFERLGRAGFETWYVPAARVLHHESSATGGRTSRVALYYFIRNRHRFVRKFKRGQPVYFAFLAYAAVDAMRRTVWLALHGSFGLAAAVIRATLDAWTGKLGPETPAPPAVAHHVEP
jgi:GT2 family glycosyltransferase